MAELIVNVLKNKKVNKYTIPRLIQILIVCLSFNGLFCLSIYYAYMHPPEANYYITSFNGQVEKIADIHEPNTSDSVVKQWSNIAVIDIFTYDFVNYERALQQVSQYFTDDGWSSFLNTLNNSNNLPTVISKKLVVSAVAIKPPLILMKGMLNGVYSWRIQIPVLVTYQSASEFIQQTVLINLLVTRISTLENPKGIGIEQFVVSSYLPDQSINKENYQ